MATSGDTKDEDDGLEWQDDDADVSVSSVPVVVVPDDKKQLPLDIFYREQRKRLSRFVKIRTPHKTDELETYRTAVVNHVNRIQLMLFDRSRWQTPLHDLFLGKSANDVKCTIVDATTSKPYFRFGSPTDIRCVSSYASRIRLLVAFLKQLEESSFLGWHFLTSVLAFRCGMWKPTDKRSENKLVVEMNRIILGLLLAASPKGAGTVHPDVLLVQTEAVKQQATGLVLIPLMTDVKQPRTPMPWTDSSYVDAMISGTVPLRVVQSYGLAWKQPPVVDDPKWSTLLQTATIAPTLLFSSIVHLPIKK